MQNMLSEKTLETGICPRKTDMRDILTNMEELASMIGIKASGYQCEILSIEPPGVFEHGPLDHPVESNKRYTSPGKSQVLPFEKK